MLRTLLANLAWKLGWVTWYHISYQFPVCGGYATGDLCVSVRPWIRRGETFEKLREYIAQQAAEQGCNCTPNIISITRIGA